MRSSDGDIRVLAKMHRTSHESYLQNVVAKYEQERSGLSLENVGPTFSSLTMLLGRKSLKIIDLLEIDFIASFLCSEGYFVDQ